MKKNLPFVFSNFAMTADGKIAFADGGFTAFSSRRDREHMMELRATADAVICGARTIEVTGTILGNGGEKFGKQRLEQGRAEHPLRIIVSGSGSINPAAKIFRKQFSPIVVLTTARISKSKLKKLRAVADEVKVSSTMEIDFPAALRWLRKKWKVKRLLCEGGGQLHCALVRADLLDELHLTVCPKIFGGRNAPTIADGEGVLRLAEAAGFKLKSANRVEDELFAIFSRKKTA
jgi:5-amino-6-(5-phosphoribosylamino)uracil reductase